MHCSFVWAILHSAVLPLIILVTFTVLEVNFNIIFFWDVMSCPLLVTIVSELSACIFMVE